MTDYVWPNGARISSCDWRPISNSRYTPGTFDGGQQTATRPGDKLGCRVRVNNSSGAERAKLRALAHALRGRGNRLFLPDYSFRQRGSFPSRELFSNYDFSSGATGWLSGTRYSLSASDGVLRATIIAQPGDSGRAAYQGLTTPLAEPVITRVVFRHGRRSSPSSIFYAAVEGAFVSGSVSDGYLAQSVVPSNATSNSYGLYDNQSTGSMAGDYVDISFMSASRCFLVDGGGNLATFSDVITNAAWSKSNSTASSVSGSDPFGTSTAEALIENSANTSHFINRSLTRASGAAWICAFGMFKQRTGSRNVRLAAGNTALNYSHCIYDLSTGTAGAVSNVGTATSGLAYIKSMGNGWYFCQLMTFAETATTAYLEIALASSGSISYTGDGSSSIYMTRLGEALSDSPTRGAQTTSSAVVAESQSSSSIHVKGLPLSTSGLLLRGDLVEINKIIYPVAADLNSDAAGLGYLQLAFPPPRAIADGTPIIVCRPMGRMVLMNDPEISCMPGGFSDFEFDFVQDLAA